MQHPVQDGRQPVLKHAVVVVGNQEVADAVDTLAAQLTSRQGELAQVRGSQTLDEVFLDAPCCCHDAVNLMNTHTNFNSRILCLIL